MTDTVSKESERAEEVLESFVCSVFAEKEHSMPGRTVGRAVFARRLYAGYRNFLKEGLSGSRAAAAAIGTAGNMLCGWGIFAGKAFPAEETKAAAGTSSLLISKEREEDNEMKNSLRVYVDSLFGGAPETAAVKELHDEILSNLEERYDDCIAGGMTPQRAYTAVVGTMGDIGKLIRQVSEEGQHPAGLFERSSPTGKGIFKKYSYIFTDENLKIIKGSAIAVMWILLTAFYFMVSFYSEEWETTWILFLVGAGLNVAINMAGDIARFSRPGDNPESRVRILKSIRGNISAILWLAATFFFFLIGMNNYGEFETSWILFILAAAVQVVISAVMKIQINRYK